jgi:transmembrane sensor
MTTMPAADDRVRELIAQEAADWFVANRGLGESEHVRFAAWLRTSPTHVEEYIAIASIAQQLPGTRCATAPSIESLLAEASAADRSVARRIRPPSLHLWAQRSGRNWFHAAVVAMGIVGVAGLLALWVARRPVAQVPDVGQYITLRTEHGQLADRQLTDHSVIRLDTDSDLTVRYTAESRFVHLVAGRANFQVAHEAKRGFSVLAGVATVDAVGTNFDVRLEDAATVVTVYEGRVRVGRAGAPAVAADSATADAIPLAAGQQLRVEAGAWPAVPVSVDSARSGAWLHGQIRFQNEPIEQVAAEFNRYSRRPIRILTPELRTMAISGSFSTADVDAFVLFLRGLDGVKVHVSEADIRVTRP